MHCNKRRKRKLSDDSKKKKTLVMHNITIRKFDFNVNKFCLTIKVLLDGFRR